MDAVVHLQRAKSDEEHGSETFLDDNGNGHAFELNAHSDILVRTPVMLISEV
jgi:hypothetical protein